LIEILYLPTILHQKSELFVKLLSMATTQTISEYKI